MYSAQHLCLTLIICRCEHLVLLPATSEGLVGAEMATPGLLTDNTSVRWTILCPCNPGGVLTTPASNLIPSS